MKGFAGWMLATSLGALAATMPAPTSAQSDPGLVGVGDWSGPLDIRFDAPVFAGDPVTAIVPGDGCFQGGGPRIEPERTVVDYAGSTVTIDLYSTMPLCFSAGDPLGVWIYRQPLDPLDAGEYEIVVRYHYIETPSAAPFATLTTTLTVLGGADTSPLDSHAPWSLGMLVLVLAAAGVRARRTT